MNINRNNYEEFFILYLDNELPHHLRAEVEAFAESQPDLKMELELLLQSKLIPEEIIFENKESLLKIGSNETSFEQGIVLYLDNELNPDEKKEVENLISTHDKARTEFELFAKTKLQPENITFPDKSVLYRHEQGKPVSMYNWKRLAAAAVLFVGISTAAYFFLNKENYSQDNGLAKVDEPVTTPKTKSGDEKNADHVVNTTITSQPEIVNSTTASDIKAKELVATTSKVAEEKKLIASAAYENPMPTNNLPTPTEENPYVYSGKLSSPVNTIADVRIPQKETLTSNPAITQKIAVTPTSLQPLYTSNTSSEEDDVRQKGKRGGFRGFVRKITRTFEKTTDFEATDGDDRLLVAGLAIKL